jgi:ribosomal protein S18 acetylase RimI-like enzyme
MASRGAATQLYVVWHERWLHCQQKELITSIRLEYKPKTLKFSAFSQVDTECFPDEPLDEASFFAFLGQDFWAALDNDHFVGYCSVQRKPDFAWLRRIGVDQTYRKQGIGRQLMQAAVDHSRKVGLPEMILYVQHDNRPAMHLYESFAFQRAEITFQYEYEIAQLYGIQLNLSQQQLMVIPINEVPISQLPAFSRQWSDIAAIHNPPYQHVLVFHDGNGNGIGYCRLTPSFPGCFPFVINKPGNYLLNALRGLRPYLNPEKVNLKLTIDDPTIAQLCESFGFQLNYTMYKMIRSPKK